LKFVVLCYHYSGWILVFGFVVVFLGYSNTCCYPCDLNFVWIVVVYKGVFVVVDQTVVFGLSVVFHPSLVFVAVLGFGVAFDIVLGYRDDLIVSFPSRGWASSCCVPYCLCFLFPLALGGCFSCPSLHSLTSSHHSLVCLPLELGMESSFLLVDLSLLLMVVA